MFYIISVIMGYIAYMFGAVSFCQIVGSIRTRTHIGAFLLWSVLTIAVCGLTYVYLNKYFYAVAAGLAISFLVVLFTPKIE